MAENEALDTPVPEETQEIPAEQAAASAEEVITSEESPSSEDTKPKKSGVQKRIDELVREREEAKREAESYKRQYEASKGGGDAPKLEDFESYEDFLTARTIHQFEQRQRQQKAEQDEQYRQALAQENAQLFAQRQIEAKVKYADYEQVANNPNLEITPQMAQIITAQENGPDIAYYLGKNPRLASEIARSDPINAAIKIGQVIAKVSTQTPKATSAPDPVAPIGGGSEVPELDPSQMSMEQYVEWRRKQRDLR